MLLLITFCVCFNLINGIWWYDMERETTTEPSFPSGVTSEEFYFQDKILQHHFIIPGTKYCGTGNKSSGPNDLGYFKQVDTCCREHDLCPDNIPAGKYKYGLHNRAKFTKSHCSCDETFHECLKNIGTPPARFVGALYFTFFHINCFKKEHPVIDCATLRYRRCLEYKLNFSDTPVYQWFDNPFWRHWVDQFPPEMMNITLLNITSTTPMSVVNSIEEVNTENVNASSEVIVGTTPSPPYYFGSYLQNLYSSVVNYVYNWTSSFTNNEIVEVTTVTNVNITTPVLNDNVPIDLYVLNN